VVISRELRWWTQIEEARAKAATEAATASREHAAARAASTEAVVEGVPVQPEEERPAELLHREPEALTQLWSVRDKIRPVKLAAMLIAMMLTLGLIVDFAVVVVLAITVDPYRPLSVLTITLTLVFYIINSVEVYKRQRKKFTSSVKAQYLAKHGTDSKNKHERKKSMQMLKDLIDEELEAVGLSTGRIAMAVAGGLVCMLLLLGVVLLAQQLFYAHRGSVRTQRVCCAVSMYKRDHLPRHEARDTDDVEIIEEERKTFFCRGLESSSPPSSLALVRKTALFIHLYIKRTFYQDRLGTNIGKALKKEWRFS
jgi:hypothetical protein